MPKHTPRWSWLAIFAACNLAFWLAVAIAVGVTATDLVDLGVESFLRQKQATVIAVQVAGLGKLPSGTPPPTSVVALEPTATPAVMELATDVVGTPSTTPPAASDSTPAAPGVRMTPYASRTPSAPPPPAKPTAQSQATVASRSQAAQATPTLIPASSPLLLAHPDVNDLAAMDAELRHSAAGRPIQIRYREDALNHELASVLAGYPDLPFRNLEIDLQPGQVTVHGDATVMGVEMPATIVGTVEVQDCQPVAVIHSVSVGSILTPAFVKEEIARLLEEWLASYPPDHPLCLEQIVIEEDRVTIYGRRR